MPLVEPTNDTTSNSQTQLSPNFGAPSTVSNMPSGNKRLLLVAVLMLLAAVGVVSYVLLKTKGTDNSKVTVQPSASPAPQTSEFLTLDPAKNYGNKYADGILPVGDNMYATDRAKKGYVYLCRANFVPSNQAGAQTRGPWFTNNNTSWDSKKKIAIQGAVTWQHTMTVRLKDGKRVVATNDLPDHKTGVFPVAASDPARAYDANPNTIKNQSLTYTLTVNPTLSTKPNCMGGEVGIMLSGVALFNAFDAGGRDAGAWEVQDACDGHPQSAGEYHYHTLSRCITDMSVEAVIGYALDGLPITGPRVGDNNILTTSDLDECHGIVSQIVLDGQRTTSYHYVMTQDFPYSVSCFRAEATQPPGQHENAGSPPDHMPPPPQ